MGLSIGHPKQWQTIDPVISHRKGLEEVQLPNGRRRVQRFTFRPGEHPAKLAKIKTVGDAWTEYMFGIGGNKPAKDFTDKESGAISTYSRRRPIYQRLALLVRAGKAPAVAIRLINDQFPGWSLLKIAQALRKGESDGTLHPSLCV